MITKSTLTEHIAFSGSIPANYEDYLGPLLFEPYSRYVAEHIQEINPYTILELSCGTGRLTRQLKQLLPESRLIATDINPDMIANAKEQVRNVDWLVVDAVSLPFDKEELECIVAQFGVMFYSNRIKAYQEVNRALKSSGHFVFTAWDSLDHNIAAKITHQVAAEFFPSNSPSFYELFPFGYHDEELIRRELAEASFNNVKIEIVKLTGYAHNPKSAAQGLVEGMPIYSSIVERDAGMLAAIKKEVAKELELHFGLRDLQVPIQARLVTAIKE